MTVDTDKLGVRRDTMEGGISQRGLAYESVDLSFTTASAAATGTVTSGSTSIGFFVKSFESAITSLDVLKITQSGTTLTGTLRSVPDAAATYTVLLIKQTS